MSKNKNKKIGFWICTSLVIGNMIGSGIFLLPSSLAQYGGISIFGWIFTSLGAVLLALVFVRLSRRQPGLGGPYAFARDNLGEFPGFMVAWCYNVGLWCGNAAIAVALVSYLGYFFPELDKQPDIGLAIALATVWLLTVINSLGVREAGLLQLLSTLLKALPLLIIGLAVVIHFEPQAFTPLNSSDESNFAAITATAAITLWAFLGLESATVPNDNVHEPSRTIPRATIVGVVTAAVIYISCTATVMSVIPNAQLAASGAPFAEAAKYLWGDWAGYLIAATAVISCFGALNGWILIQGQMPMALANDGLFPKLFKANAKGVPVKGLLVTSFIVSVVTFTNYHGSLVKLFTFSILLSTLSLLIPYLFAVIAELKHLYDKKSGQMLLWLVPVFALAYVLWAISGIGKDALIVGLGLCLVGVPIYYFLRGTYQETS